MAKLFLIVPALFINHVVVSQVIRTPLGSNRPLTDIDLLLRYLQLEPPAQRIQQGESSQYFTQSDPYSIVPISNTLNFLLNIPNSPINVPNFPLVLNPPLNSECSPSVCKNLANTIHLMILTDYLQNQDGGDEVSLRIAAPILTNLLPKPVSGGFSHLPNSAAPRLLESLTYPTPRIVVSTSSVQPPSISPRIVTSGTSNSAMSSGTSDRKTERGLLIKLLKSLGDGL